MAWIVAAALVAFSVVAWVVALRNARRGPSVPVGRRRIAALDLNVTREKARRRHGWDADKALALEAEYRDFLALVAENPGKVISPWSNDLDLFWHEHILDTRKYERDCQWVFGRLVEHDPHIERNARVCEEVKKHTARLRQAQLSSRAARERAAMSASSTSGDDGSGFSLVFWGCAATEPAAHAPSGGDSGHHSCGGGHSCGGHSCGGHSCGGSSCGGGACGGS